jgi:sugar phosphate isomerase/epimerase
MSAQDATTGAFPLACADFTFPLLPHENVLDLIAMLELGGVDIGLFQDRSHLQPRDQLDQPDARGKRLGEQLRARGLACADVFLQCALDFVAYAINHPDAPRRHEVRELFDRTIDYALASGSSHVTTLPGVLHEGESDADSLARAHDELAWRVERCREAGIAFGVEAHVGSLAPDPQSAAALVANVSGLKLTLDYTHFTRAGLPDAEIEPLVDHANHFHLRGAAPGRLQTSFAENTIDYARVLDRMRETGYPGFVGIEYTWTEWERCNETDNLSETILWRDFVGQRRGGDAVGGAT